MSSSETQAKLHITIAVIAVFTLLFLFFPWKIVLSLLLVWVIINSINSAITYIKKERIR